jgi:hypothetical protein
MAKWQKSFRAIPADIQRKIESLKSKTVVVGCATKLSAKDIHDGVYRHLGIVLESGNLRHPERIVPDSSAGSASDFNANGRVIVRKDLPKITKVFTVETPNFGDWSKGSHDVSQSRKVYQRDFLPPDENEITVELIGQEGDSEEKSYVFRFMVDQPVRIGAKDFENDLLRLLNLLQENVGSVDLFPSDATLEDYLKTIYVNWEILPPGERDTNIAKITAGIGSVDEKTRKRVIDRYTFLEKLRPQAFIQGFGGFRRYFGAKFTNQLVAFENMEYGNAIYVMLADWKEASKKTKQELLASGRDGEDFFRVVHTDGWKAQVRGLIRKYRR